ncbi:MULTISPECIES: hypothetical protein [unclassified Nonomuraea]|uniref:hypothetical protein n=1 Tax=unclassified Nonomuraea TaxID=2593643 RepID=UPI003406C2FB
MSTPRPPTGPRLSAAEAAVVLLATLPLTGAAAVLLTVVRPRIPRAGGMGFVAHARTSGGDELLTALATGPAGEAGGR